MFFEHKALYRSVEDEVPENYYTLPIGKAKIVREGNEMCIITYGAGVQWAVQAVNESSIDAEIIDLRSLLPWDKDQVKASAEKTGKVMMLHEDTLTGGIGAEIAAWISEHCFQSLDAPVMRCASLDTPVPFAIPLEQAFLAKARLKEKLLELASY
jgi:2-oxoisovalerate dehydrogenase E1 component